MKEKKCPCGNGCMNLKMVEEKTVFKGVDLNIKSEKYICPHCGIEAGTLKQAALIQASISNSYRDKVGLLSGDTIKRMRSDMGLSQKQLAGLVGVSTREIKGWETCTIQNRLEDKSLRMVLKDHGTYGVTKWSDSPEDE